MLCTTRGRLIVGTRNEQRQRIRRNRVHGKVFCRPPHRANPLKQLKKIQALPKKRWKRSPKTSKIRTVPPADPCALLLSIHKQIVSDSLTVDTNIHNDEQTRIFAGQILIKLIESSSDAQGSALPFMIWTASRPVVRWRRTSKAASNGSPKTAPAPCLLAASSQAKLCTASATPAKPTNSTKAVDFLLQISDDKSGLAAAALQGFIDGQNGKQLIPDRDIKTLFATLHESSDTNVQSGARELGTLWNDPDSLAATRQAHQHLIRPRSTNASKPSAS